MAIFEIITGEEIFSSGTAKFNAFFRRRADAAEDALFNAAKDMTAGIRTLQAAETINAGPTSYNGKWIKNRYDLPDISYVKLIGQIRQGGGFSYTTEMAMLRIRATGPFQRIKFKLTEDLAANISVAYCEGNFDLVLPDEFEQLGIKVKNLSYFEEWGNLRITKLSEELSKWSPPRMKTLQSSDTLTEIKRPLRRVRRINLKPRGRS